MILYILNKVSHIIDGLIFLQSQSNIYKVGAKKPEQALRYGGLSNPVVLEDIASDRDEVILSYFVIYENLIRLYRSSKPEVSRLLAALKSGDPSRKKYISREYIKNVSKNVSKNTIFNSSLNRLLMYKKTFDIDSKSWINKEIVIKKYSQTGMDILNKIKENVLIVEKGIDIVVISKTHLESISEKNKTKSIIKKRAITVLKNMDTTYISYLRDFSEYLLQLSISVINQDLRKCYYLSIITTINENEQDIVDIQTISKTPIFLYIDGSISFIEIIKLKLFLISDIDTTILSLECALVSINYDKNKISKIHDASFANIGEFHRIGIIKPYISSWDKEEIYNFIRNAIQHGIENYDLIKIRKNILFIFEKTLLYMLVNLLRTSFQ